MIQPITSVYQTFNQSKVDAYLAGRQAALPILAENLRSSNNEKEIVEDLYIFNRMIDDGIKDTESMYPVLSRFNQTKSPAIQTFLAGIYRKLQIPDAFGPLVVMLIKNSISPYQIGKFDPNEEIGGAILSYIEGGSR